MAAVDVHSNSDRLIFPDGVVRCFVHNLPAKLFTSGREHSKGRKFYKCSFPINDERRCEFFYWKDELEDSFPWIAERDQVRITIGASQSQAQPQAQVVPLTPPPTQYVLPANVPPQSPTETLRSQTLPSPESSPVPDRLQPPLTPPRQKNSIPALNRGTKRPASPMPVDDHDNSLVQRPAVRSRLEDNPIYDQIQLHTPPPTGHRNHTDVRGKAPPISPLTQKRRVRLAQGGLGGQVLRFPKGSVEANPSQAQVQRNVEEAPNTIPQPSTSTSNANDGPYTVRYSFPISLDKLDQIASFAQLFNEDLGDTLRALPDQVSELMQALERSERKCVELNEEIAGLRRRLNSGR